MPILVEFKVNKTLFDDVKNDPDFRFGFEAEFHVRNASSLLRDEAGYLPDDFETYSTNLASLSQSPMPMKSTRTSNSLYHEGLTLIRLCGMFEHYLGLRDGDITIEHTNYQKWMILVDPSLYDNPNVLNDPDHDLGVELVSPVMTLRDGLVWMAKVCDMIANFNEAGLTIYTSELTSLHTNLSHVRIGKNFDFAKLAILSSDESYLEDFNRLGNQYTYPLLRAVYELLVSAKEKPDATQPNALRLLNLRGWSPARVMEDLAGLIPMTHYMSVDLSRLAGNNPYIEIRIAGNAGYEKRFDEVAQLAIRFAALIKVACDPMLYRQEYLKKIYQLVAGVTSAPAQQTQQAPVQNPFPRVRIYLSPIMSIETRAALDRLETYSMRQSLAVPNGALIFLSIIRNAIQMRQTQNPRIRQGLVALLKAIRVQPTDLAKALRQRGKILLDTGVLRPQDRPTRMLAYLTDYVKYLNQSIGQKPLMNGLVALETDMLTEQTKKQKKRRLNEQDERVKREKKRREAQLAEQNYRIKMKAARPIRGSFG